MIVRQCFDGFHTIGAGQLLDLAIIIGFPSTAAGIAALSGLEGHCFALLSMCLNVRSRPPVGKSNWFDVGDYLLQASMPLGRSVHRGLFSRDEPTAWRWIGEQFNAMACKSSFDGVQRFRVGGRHCVAPALPVLACSRIKAGLGRQLRLRQPCEYTRRPELTARNEPKFDLAPSSHLSSSPSLLGTTVIAPLLQIGYTGRGHLEGGRHDQQQWTLCQCGRRW
jgi:hypothetical protein